MKEKYINFVINELKAGVKHNRTALQNKAKEYGIVDKTKVKEYTELAIVLLTRELATKRPLNTAYNSIVDVYKRQMNMSFRTSISMLLQQYSTPAPIGFLMGMYCGLQDKTKTFFEPSAGNGLLTILGNPKKGIVNEIDSIRRNNLEYQDQYNFVGNEDASKPFTATQIKNKQFDAILSNPPFGKLPSKKDYHGFPISDLDHWMVFNALKYMKPRGKAAFIIGGHTKYDKHGRIQRGKNSYFLHALYRYFNVEDVIPIDGHKLYSRQGTAFDTRLILINGKKENPEGNAPLITDKLAKVETDFNSLFDRVNSLLMDKSLDNAKAKAIALKLKIKLLNLQNTK